MNNRVRDFSTNRTVLVDEMDTPFATAAATCLERAKWQQTLFAPFPKRRSVQELARSWPVRTIRVRIHRNHAFEPLEAVLRQYLAFAGFAAEFVYSQYDDSLSFYTGDSAEVELVWLDLSRYAVALGIDEIAQWLGSRLTELRQRTAAPILVLMVASSDAEGRAIDARLRTRAADLVGLLICDQAPIHEELGSNYFDSRAAITGTRLSNAACIHTARHLGSLWIPGALEPRLKALVLDLDDTLYYGALAEEGIAGVRLTADHAALQHRLVALWKEGLLLSVCSKNEPTDVRELFAARTDFPLGLKHFSAVEAGWGAKRDGILRISKSLGIGTDAMLYVDDNPGELADVASGMPALKTLYAGPRAADVVNALVYFPGLHRWHADETDVLRAPDLAAAETRRKMGSSTRDASEYFRSLDIHLRFARNRCGDVERLAALSRKTNQFNLALRRLTSVDVARFISTPNQGAVSVRLCDRLSDSGIVAALFFRREGETLMVEEVCVSCRALGRRLEDVMILGAIRFGAEGPPPVNVRFCRVEGARNKPAIDWLGKLSGGVTSQDGWVSVPWNVPAIEKLIANIPITLQYE